MQKRFIAALIAALPLPVLADTANVTIYGAADVSFDMANTGTATGKAGGTTVNKVSSSSSRLGFKGDEDLGDGLKAIWQIESEVDLDGTDSKGNPAGSALGNRNTFGGLKNDNWGSLILGRHDTPYKTSDRRLDLFYDHVADNRALMAGGKGKSSADSLGFAKRATDTAIYNSPIMNGFKAAIGYVAGAEMAAVSGPKGSIWSLAGTYDAAPFFGSLAYQKNDYGAAGTGVVAAANGASPNTSERAWKLGGGYKVDQFAVNAVYEKTDDNFGGPAATNAFCKTAAAGASCYGHNAVYISGQYNITPNDAVKLAYTRSTDLRDGNAAGTGAKHTSVGYDHIMSKRTKFYVTYTRLNNDANAQYSLNGEAQATGDVIAQGPGASPSSLYFGMMHTF